MVNGEIDSTHLREKSPRIGRGVREGFQEQKKGIGNNKKIQGK